MTDPRDVPPADLPRPPSWNSADATRVIDPAARPEAPGSLHVNSTEHASVLVVPPAGEPLGEDGFPLVGGVVAGFLLEAELGRGSFGRAYLARQQELSGRPVVLKFTAAGFVSEAHALARLQHTNIVPLFSLHRVGPLVGLCMPYFRGPTVSAVLHALRQLPAPPASGRWLVERLGPGEDVPGRQALARGSHVGACLRLAAGLADGLAHAHERGIVHRDVKPANVLLTAEGEPMLLDFNLARDAGKELTDRAGGTLPYMAPEALEALAREQSAGDARQDVFGLGVVLFELLTGRFPYIPRVGPAGDVLPLLIADRRAGPPDPRGPNPAVSPATAAIVRRCLEPDPERRYPSARALHDDLTRQIESRPLLHTPEPSLVERARKWSRRHPRVGVAAVLALLVVMLVGTTLAVWHHNASLARQNADLEARQALAHLDDAMRRLPAERAAWPGRCEELLAPFGLPAADWQERPPASRLDETGRLKLRLLVGQLLWFWGRSLGGPLGRLKELNARARECFDDPPPALLRQQAELLRRGGDEDEARRVLSSLEGRKNTERDDLFDALDHADRGHWDRALPLLREAAASAESQGKPWVYQMLSRAHLLQGRVAGARAYAELTTGLEPRWAWAWNHRGALALTDNDPNDALASFDEALRRGGGADARLNRALTLRRLRRPKEALAELDRLLSEEGTPTRVWFEREKARREAGDMAGAREDHERGLAATPADAESWDARAVARLPADPEGALRDLEEGLKLAPRSAPLLRNKAHVLSEHLGRRTDGVRALTAALEVVPGDVTTLSGRAVLYARGGEMAKALADCRAVEARRDADGRSLYCAACARALLAEGRPAEATAALAVLRRALLLEPVWAEVAAVDPDLKALQGRPAFIELLRSANDWKQRPDRF